MPSKQESAGTSLESLMNTLAGKNGMLRLKARESLVAIGKPAVACLAKALQKSKVDQVRWEAAKALGAIGDAKSIPQLVKALEDSNSDVAWLAAEALHKFGKAAWPSLLRAVTKMGPDSASLRHGAHHVLRNQKEDGFNDLLATLMAALESEAVPESAAVAAYDILKRMKDKS